MAISIQNLPTLFAACKSIPQKNFLLILGDANICFNSSDFKQSARNHDYALQTSQSSDFDCFAFGKALGFNQVETLDINGKTTHHFNLHDELPPELKSRFDCVIDAGVLYWCFDVATALKNIYKMAKPTGVIVHSAAITGYFGRSYYNIHPKAFEDFYFANQAKLIEMSTYTRDPSLINRAFKLIKGAGRIQRLFGVEASTPWISKNNQKNIFIESSSSGTLSFKSELTEPEPTLIPNNVVGTFAFQKTQAAEPIIPVLST